VVISVHEFLEEFEVKYGELHPPFYVGSFEDAKSTARETGKFLLVYLHGQGEEVDLFCQYAPRLRFPISVVLLISPLPGV